MGITHILRGKDHLNNTHRQKYIYKYLNWPTPEFLHYGWVSLPKVILKTTTIKEGILAGKFSDWSDSQLGTMQALAKRGIKPDAIRKYWLDVGIKEVDIKFSWETLYALNKDIIDKTTDRYFFVCDPIPLVITGVSELTGSAPLHPDDPDRGSRKTILKAANDKSGDTKTIKLLVTKEDISDQKTGTKLRLKDLCNIELLDINSDQKSRAKYIGNDLSILKEGAKIIHWVPASENHPITVHFQDGNIRTGFCEMATLNALSKTVQFERFGFVNLDKDPGPPLMGWFAHK
jgi:glutamyl-tRNA synthetase